MSQTSSLPHDPDGLSAYFTDVEYLRDVFQSLVAAPTLPKRLMMIHGVGGVGKSSLLRMFRLHCKHEKVPVALASGDDAKSAQAILGDWADDLKADSVTLPTFAKTLDHYHAIQAKAEDKAQESRKKMGELASKAAGKVAETAAGAAIGAAVGSVIPGIGTLVGALGGMGAEALVDWLRGQGFVKSDIDLLLDPTSKLTNDFLSDLAQVASNRRLVLMLDTFEQLTTLDDWACDLAQRLHPNVLWVLAGRAMPNWSRAWSGWLAQAHVEELEPMTEDVMRTLVGRYYATMHGGEPDRKQVEAIIRFARGLPMVVTTAVRLWVEYGVEDFETVKAEVVADLVDRLKEGVPEEMSPVLEAAATVRWFNKEILRAVTTQADVNKAYDELRRFPFVRPRVEGLMLHDAVREIMDEYLRVHDPERHRELHERAAAYFEKRLEKIADARQGTTGGEAERQGLERLYHRVRADEEAGIKLFQDMAEELTCYRLVNKLRALLNDVNTYCDRLEHENNRLWVEYYKARLAYLEIRYADAEQIYQVVQENEQVEPKLRAYALCDWGEICKRPEHLIEPGGRERALDILERSQRWIPLDSKLALVFSHRKDVYATSAQWKMAVQQLECLLQFFKHNADIYGIIRTFALLKEVYGVLGDWKKAADSYIQGLQSLQTLSTSPFLRARLTGHSPWDWLWSGHYTEAEQGLRKSVALARQSNDMQDLPGLLRGWGLSLGYQTKYKEAEKCFVESAVSYGQGSGKRFAGIGINLGFSGTILCKQGELGKAEQTLVEALSIKQKVGDSIGIPELHVWLGELNEIRVQQAEGETRTAKLSVAESYYQQGLGMRWTGRHYFESAALTGLIRVKHAQGDYAAIPPLLTEAEQLAQQYEYNDHLASLRLTQAQTFEALARNLEGRTALGYFKQAMVYALRYNRFLLDEVLSGRPQGTPLRPIIPYCLERGEEGRRILVALRDWWTTSVNDVGTPRSDTISPIPEGIPLIEAERIAREREPGDGSPQATVIEQIEPALTR